MEWEIVIGIETHAQLSTRSKIFSRALTAFGAAPNTQACAIDMALPGTLPVLNEAAVERAIRFGLKVGGDHSPGWNINRRSVFERKNYFYPDLPKGYQISQYQIPIVKGGSVTIWIGERSKTIRLTRAHLEEDAGKSLHEDFHSMSGIDLNRAGTPLLEIVSEPDMRSAEEAVAYARALHEIVTWNDICDGNMEEGSFRCDANVSVRRLGGPLGTRREIKNLNSFRFLQQAIEYEAQWQIERLEAGGTIEQATVLFDPNLGETRMMRTKEEAHDYRYFPDPDLLPLVITDTMIDDVRKSIPESREEERLRFQNDGVPPHTVSAVTANIGMTRFYESMWNHIKSDQTLTATQVAQILTSAANTTVTSLSARFGDFGFALTQRPDLPKELALIEIRVGQGRISSVAAKEVRDAVLEGRGTADEIIKTRGLEQISDAGAIGKIVDEVLAANPQQVADYRSGKEKAFNSLVGQVMKATRGKANPAQVNEILKKKLG
jgi:aspartyl-tRNA(Asn)/glutamyl-tRNA(Gln) amidotransferase subunit B